VVPHPLGHRLVDCGLAHHVEAGLQRFDDERRMLQVMFTETMAAPDRRDLSEECFGLLGIERMNRKEAEDLLQKVMKD